MNIDRVTITGADNNTDPQEIINISKEFPFVEWGILFSKNRLNTPRYPIKHYGYLLKSLAQENFVEIQLSAHICGAWTKEFFNGDFTFEHYLSPLVYGHIFNRVQLNFNATNYPYKLDKVIDIIKRQHVPFIFQHNRSNTKLCNEVQKYGLLDEVAFLYDSSGGRGASRSEWPAPVGLYYTGYAGGLNPVNLEEQIKLIEKSVSNDERIWIDVETGVRTADDNLDLVKVREFLTIASKYVRKYETRGI
ncbi:MAG: hypothetical protein E6Q38_00895 [Crocinitomicaceae bacterium]|nr:MAG: hypothetical protein E6Q38_00895 [Crocinitomicaceae bacterium]